VSVNEIEVNEPGRATRRITVDPSLEVGREVEGLLLDDAGVSRHHARFWVEDGRLMVTDLGSTNGTTVNGVRITAPTTWCPEMSSR
jgi:pSer/pThr/pTyr-binding forkhead associated (FHA) protein